MFITRTQPSYGAATMPYVWPPVSYTSAFMLVRVSNPPGPSNMVDTKVGRAGSVTSSIYTQSAYEAATAPYMRPPILNTSTSAASYPDLNPP